MASPLELIGWLFIIFPLGWLTSLCLFTTTDTFIKGLLSGSLYHKMVGIAFWIFIVFLWVCWFNVGVT